MKKIFTAGFICLVIMVFVATFIAAARFDGKTFVANLVAHDHNTTIKVEHTHVEFATCNNLSEEFDWLTDKVDVLDEIDTLQAQAIMELYSLLPGDVLEDFLHPDSVPEPKEHRIQL